MQQVLLLTDKQYDDFTPGALIARQGDVLLFKPHTKPVAGKRLETGGGRVVLAHGEVTGHAHAFYHNETTTVPPASAYELYETNAPKCAYTCLPGRLLRLNTRSFLRHEEHSPHSLPPRDFVVVIQHEGDELGELRKTAD